MFFGHGSVGMEYDGKAIYVDPVGMFHDYAGDPKADVILVTHQHDDHLDPKAIELLSKPGTEFITTRTVADETGKGKVMKNGDKFTVGGWLHIEAIPAYNGPERQQFHPHTGRDNGYLLTMGGTRVYFSGDTEPTPEMGALGDIDIAFLSTNQPYTMTVDQAVSAARTINPAIFYPYHYGNSGQETDITRLVKELEGSGIDVRIRPME